MPILPHWPIKKITSLEEVGKQSPMRINEPMLVLRQVYKLKSYFLGKSETLKPVTEDGQKLRIFKTSGGYKCK